MVTAEMKLATNYLSWDFDHTWRISEGNYYPLLRALTKGKITLDATARDLNKVYDNYSWSGGVIDYSGFDSGDSPSSGTLEGTLKWIGTAEGAVNAGSYSLIPTGLYSQKYEIEYTPGILTILPRPLDIAVTKTYDGNNFFSSGYLVTSGVATGDATPVISGTATVASANAGNYDGWLTNNLVTDNPNYTANLADIPGVVTGLGKVNATIDQAGVSLLGVTGSREYDGTVLANWNDNTTLSGVITEDIGKVTLVSGSGILESKDAGVRSLLDVGSLSLGGDQASNYKLTTTGSEWLIKPASLNMNGQKIFDASNLIKFENLQFEGLIGSDAINPTGYVLIERADVGSYDRFGSGEYDLGNSNYAISGNSEFAFDIEKLSVNFWGGDRSIVNGDVLGPYDYRVVDLSGTSWENAKAVENVKFSVSARDQYASRGYGAYAIGIDEISLTPNFELANAYSGTLLVRPTAQELALLTVGLGDAVDAADSVRRTLNQNLPTYVQANAKGSPWIRVTDPTQDVFHQNGIGLTRDIKFYHPDGREVVFDGDTLKIVTNWDVAGTYNFSNNDTDTVGHIFKDVLISREAQSYYSQRTLDQVYKDAGLMNIVGAFGNDLFLRTNDVASFVYLEPIKLIDYIGSPILTEDNTFVQSSQVVVFGVYDFVAGKGSAAFERLQTRYGSPDKPLKSYFIDGLLGFGDLAVVSLEAAGMPIEAAGEAAKLSINHAIDVNCKGDCLVYADLYKDASSRLIDAMKIIDSLKDFAALDNFAETNVKWLMDNAGIDRAEATVLFSKRVLKQVIDSPLAKQWATTMIDSINGLFDLKGFTQDVAAASK